MTSATPKPRAGEHTDDEVNPYLLHGDELARTEVARRTWQSQPAAGSALNPKAAWPFPQTRAELEAERDLLPRARAGAGLNVDLLDSRLGAVARSTRRAERKSQKDVA